MRLLLFAGAGGVGTTTAAAATAALAATSAAVLLVSADAPGPDPHVLRVDVRRRFEQRWPAALPGLDPVAAAELALPPGAAELLTLLDVRDRALDGDWDAVIVDGPPVDRLLSLSELAGSLERLWPEYQRIVHRVAFADAVNALQSALESVRELLAGATVRLVVAPTPSGVAAARRAVTALALHGYALDSVIANRMLPADAGDSPWAEQVRAGQEAALAALELDVPVRRAPYLATAPVRTPELVALGREVYGSADPLGPVAAAPPAPVTRAGAEYELRMALPFVRRSEVRLARSGDDLVVTVGDQLRRLALPPLLRRCVAVGATAGDGAVRVRFRPDPELWHRDLPLGGPP